MKRSTVISTFVLAAVIALVGTFAIGMSHRAISAQDTATENHPLVGVWLLDAEPEVEGNALESVIFTDDGTFINVEVNGTTLLGAWEATGATTADLLFVSYDIDEEGGNAGQVTIRSSFEVSADGNSLTGQYTIEFVGPDGTSTGEAGPAMLTATRLEVEAQGTPVMTIDELFGSFAGTPEASPVATPTS
jgi:hypothetical protein